MMKGLAYFAMWGGWIVWIFAIARDVRAHRRWLAPQPDRTVLDFIVASLFSLAVIWGAMA